MSVRAVFRFLAILLFVLVVSVPAHARVFVSLAFPFFPFYFGPSYVPAYYYPPPYYYPPQQGYAYPQQDQGYPPQQGQAHSPPQGYYGGDAYAQNAPQSAPPHSVSPSPSQNCRTYRGDAIIDSSGRPFYGRACLEGDGRWHVVQ